MTTEVLSTPEIGAVEVERPAVTKADQLHRAADLLEEFGWCQGKLGSKAKGEMCAIGAFHEAITDLGGDGRSFVEWFPLWVAATDVMKTTVAEFNNAPGRTKAEVVAALREAAERSTA